MTCADDQIPLYLGIPLAALLVTVTILLTALITYAIIDEYGRRHD